MSIRPTIRGSSAKGARPGQEDRYFIWSGQHSSVGTFHIVAVFDGHDGCLAAELCRRHFVPYFLSHSSLSSSSPPFLTILRDTISRLETIVLTKTQSQSTYDGCTLCVFILHGRQISIANVGDSKILLIRSAGRPVELTACHNLKNESEKNRVQRTNAIIRRGRVLGERKFLEITRTLGDREMKTSNIGILSTPECVQRMVTTGDIAFLVATDGLWDRGFLSNEDIAESIREEFRKGKCVAQVVKSVVDDGVRFGKDNVTLILVKLSTETADKTDDTKSFVDRREGVSYDRRPSLPSGVSCTYWETSRAGNGHEASGSGSKRASTIATSSVPGKRKK